MPIDATVGGASANSYVTLVETDAYFADRLFTESWDALTDQNKTALLIWAATICESKVTSFFDKTQLPEDATFRVLTNLKSDSECTLVWNGDPATTDQALAWPRSGLKNANGFDLPDDEIPQRVKNWQMELALKLSVEDRTSENAAKTLGLTGLKAGPVDLKFSATEATNLRVIPDSVMQVLVPSWWYAFEIIYATKPKIVNI